MNIRESILFSCYIHDFSTLLPFIKEYVIEKVKEVENSEEKRRIMSTVKPVLNIILKHRNLPKEPVVVFVKFNRISSTANLVAEIVPPEPISNDFDFGQQYNLTVSKML